MKDHFLAIESDDETWVLCGPEDKMVLTHRLNGQDTVMVVPVTADLIKSFAQIMEARA
jgi:hypothetical protein